MKVGKLSQVDLQRMLDTISIKDPRVLVGPKIGEDAAFIDSGDNILIAAADPITFTSDRIGEYAVQINANDVAACGATPRWFLANVLLPTSYNTEEVHSLFTQMTNACNNLGASLIGGHTEVIDKIEQPIIAGCMLGEVERNKEIRTSGALPGDVIVITKGIAIEGTSILAREHSERLEKVGISAEIIEKAKSLLDNPGISIVKDAMTAVRAEAEVHAMHDLTEGGLATALWELASAAEIGLRVDSRCIPILGETAHICQLLNLDPMGLLASGSLLITVPPAGVPFLVQDLFQEGISSSIIGNCLPKSEDVRLTLPTGSISIPTFERDELARFINS
jgi:hydrogenase expression/formation protein HypE